MHKTVKMVVGLYATLAAASAAAQTTVTTSGGVSNTIPVFTGSSTVGNSAITQSNGNIGIGTTTPANVLSVNGDIDIGARFEFDNPTAYSGSSAVFGLKGLSGNKRFLFYDYFSGAPLMVLNDAASGGGVLIGSGYISAGATPNAAPASGLAVQGNVGIGTTTPSGTLDVAGPSGGLVISGANLDPRGSYSLVPLRNSAKLLEGWNRSQGGGEIDLISNRGGGGYGGFNFYDYTNDGTLNLLVAFQGNGNVGISGNVKLSGTGASITFADSTVQSTAWTGTLCGGDYAETMDVSGERKSYEPGDVLMLDPNTPGKVLKVAEPYSTLVAGIYSTKPGVVGRRQTTDPKASTTEVPMAMVGVVPTKVSAENGSIKIGDLLVTSSTPGHAMKGTDRTRLIGAIVGKAMGNLESGTGVIEVLVSLQ